MSNANELTAEKCSKMGSRVERKRAEGRPENNKLQSRDSWDPCKVSPQLFMTAKCFLYFSKNLEKWYHPIRTSTEEMHFPYADEIVKETMFTKITLSKPTSSTEGDTARQPGP